MLQEEESYNLSDTEGDCCASVVETAGLSGGYPASKKILAIVAAVWPNGFALFASSAVILFGVEEGVDMVVEFRMEEGVDKVVAFGMGIFFFFFWGVFVGS